MNYTQNSHLFKLNYGTTYNIILCSRVLSFTRQSNKSSWSDLANKILIPIIFQSNNIRASRIISLNH